VAITTQLLSHKPEHLTGTAPDFENFFKRPEREQSFQGFSMGIDNSILSAALLEIWMLKIFQ
jgi:hypothetical protein